MRFAPHRWLGLACLCAAELGCTGGLATPITLLNGSPSDMEVGGTAGKAGGVNTPTSGRIGLGTPGGTGGANGFPEPCMSADPVIADSIAESEAMFRRLLNEAIQAHDPAFCIEQPLRNFPELRCGAWASAYALANANPRRPLPTPPEGWSTFGWATRQAENAAEAKSQILSEMSLRSDGYKAFCSTAMRERTTYTGIVVARSSDAWVVGFIPD